MIAFVCALPHIAGVESHIFRSDHICFISESTISKNMLLAVDWSIRLDVSHYVLNTVLLIRGRVLPTDVYIKKSSREIWGSPGCMV